MTYFLADILYFLIYRLGRYRLRTVRDNLRRAFPTRGEKELREIERRFYRNFADSVVETLRLRWISDREMMRRMEFVNTAEIDRLMASGKSIVVYFAHTFNWEWAPSVSLHTRLKPSADVVFAQIYRPLKSEFFNNMMLRLRARFHSESFPKASALRCLLKLRKRGAVSITGFMSDQHPSHGDHGHLTTLLGIPTLMITGTETLGRKLGMAAVYWDMEKTSRGHYRITTVPIADDLSTVPEGEATERYTRLLEQTILRDPAIWLWSHKRWKHPITQTNE